MLGMALATISTASLVVIFRGQTLDRISVSVGAAVLARNVDSASALLHGANEMLYRAKQTGRNRVAVAGPGDGCGPTEGRSE